MNKELLAVAKGLKPADLVVTNGKIVNVYSGEIYDGGVAVCGDTIAAVGDVAYCIGEGTKVIDAQGNYITPGFLDGHIHPESSSLAIRPFAEGVLLHAGLNPHGILVPVSSNCAFPQGNGYSMRLAYLSSRASSSVAMVVATYASRCVLRMRRSRRH